MCLAQSHAKNTIGECATDAVVGLLNAASAAVVREALALLTSSLTGPNVAMQRGLWALLTAGGSEAFFLGVQARIRAAIAELQEVASVFSCQDATVLSQLSLVTV